MTVELFKKKVKYTNDQNEEKTATNFYIQCGDVLIPVEVQVRFLFMENILSCVCITAYLHDN